MTAPPFHAGERAVQARAGVADAATSIASFIRDYMPEQHRTFHAALPFLVVAARDEMGRAWASLLEGPHGFVSVPDATHLQIAAGLGRDDPLHGALDGGADIGLLGIDLATRRRNRVNGQVRAHGGGMTIDVTQAFGNCPQYIRPRPIERHAATPGPVHHGTALTPGQVARIAAADTFFIATGHRGADDAATSGMDASHRGGAPGFVTVSEPGDRLRFPDYAGNNFFNTLGNLDRDPRAGLLFVDFATGGLLHVTGRMTIDWTEDPSSGARRHLDMQIDGVVDRPGALSLRWGAGEDALRRLVLAEKRPESAAVTSFIFAAEDGSALPSFSPGQHLPIRVAPPQGSPLERSYSLSGPPDQGRWRISVKRQAKGAVSRLLHDGLEVGHGIEALAPAGQFGVDTGTGALVLLSAGIGLTPMVAHFHAAASQGSRPVWFIHSTRSGADHVLAGEVRDLAQRHSNLHLRIAYSRPGPGDVEGKDYDWPGRLDAARVHDTVADPAAHYLLCGPPGFVAAMRDGLLMAGTPATRVEEETF